MTTKLKLRSAVRFLASIFAGTGTAVRKDGLATYVDLDYSSLSEATSLSSPATTYLALQDETTDSVLKISYTSLLALVKSVSEPVSVITGSGSVGATDAALIVNRSAPSTTAISLPSVASRNGLPLNVADWSTSVTAHTITLTPNGAETIMRAATLDIFSNSASLGSVTLYPSTTLNGWYI